jgi:hypothetical protein
MVAMSATTQVSYAQGNGKMTVALKGSAEMFSEDGGGTWGIRVDGKTVVAPKYTEVKSDDGTYFAVQQNGKWGVLDTAGKQLVACEYASISLNTGTAVLFKTKGDTAPKYFDCKTGQFIQAKTVSSDELKQMVGEVIPGSAALDYNAMIAEADIKKAEGWVSDVPEYAKFGLSYKNGRTQLVYKGKVILDAQRVQPLWKNSNPKGVYFYYFIVKERGLYGIFVFATAIENGKAVYETKQSVPYKYRNIEIYKLRNGFEVLRADNGSKTFFLNVDGSEVPVK